MVESAPLEPGDSSAAANSESDCLAVRVAAGELIAAANSESDCLAVRVAAGELIAATYAPIGSTAASAPAASRVSFARGFSARTSTKHGISDSIAIPSAHQ